MRFHIRLDLLVGCEPVAYFLHLVVPISAKAEPDADGGSVDKRHRQAYPQAMQREVALEGEPDTERNACAIRKRRWAQQFNGATVNEATYQSHNMR